jgi:hypothetical protein
MSPTPDRGECAAEPEAAYSYPGPTWEFLGGRVRIGPRAERRALIPHAATFVALTVLLVGMRILTPSHDYVGTHQQLGFPPCSFRAVFGLPCPGCGGTTSVCFMAHGHLRDALFASVFGTAVFFGIAATWLATGFSLITRYPVALALEGRDAARAVAYSVALMLASWVLKIALTLLYPPGIPR